MTDLQILSLLMPFALLALVLLVMAMTGWQDQRNDHHRNKAR